MATAKITDKDFDTWTEDDEEAAIKQIAAESSVRYIIVEKDFVGRFPDGTILRAPVRLSVNDLNVITSTDADGGTEVDQIKALLRVLGREEDLAALEAQDLVSATDYAMKYMKVFSRVAGIALGE